MNTLIIYDSLYGNTEAVASAIAGPLGEALPGQVECRHVSQVHEGEWAQADLLVIGAAVIVWSVFFAQRRHGGLVLILLSLALLPVGGGFVPVWTGVLAGLAGTRIGSDLGCWRRVLWRRPLQASAALWPWALVAYFVSAAVQNTLGLCCSDWLVNQGSVLFLVDLALLLLSIVSAFGHDLQKGEKA